MIQDLFQNLLHPLTISCLPLVFFEVVFSMPSLASTLRRLMDLMWSPRLCLCGCTFPSQILVLPNQSSDIHLSFLLEFAYIQSVSEKGDRYNMWNNGPIVLISFSSKLFNPSLTRTFLNIYSIWSPVCVLPRVLHWGSSGFPYLVLVIVF